MYGTTSRLVEPRLRNKSGSPATFAAIRRASSLVSNLAAARRPGAPSKDRVPIVKTCEGRQSLVRCQLSGDCRREESYTMSELATALYDEEVLHGDEVPDAALELAGSKLWEGPAGSFTLSFCSGLDSCPTSPRE